MRKMHRNWKERILSSAVIYAIILGLLPGFYVPAKAINTVITPWDISAGSLNINESGIYSISGSTQINHIEVKTDATVILNKVSINMWNLREHSAISIKDNVTLRLQLSGENHLYGSKGNGATPGYAGISVPTHSQVIIEGEGVLYVYGGDAGDGGDGLSGFISEAGGGGAGAGIGGNGGNGGAGVSGRNNGGTGETAGNIVVCTAVYAYGGGGGSGGLGAPHQTGSAGGAGGGYPAAGIGGGGAGGGSGGTIDPGIYIYENGHGGFSGGGGGVHLDPDGVLGAGGENGTGGNSATITNPYRGGGGGGYFSAGRDAGVYKGGALGGGGAGGALPDERQWAEAASGGMAGGVQSIVITLPAQVKSYNGSWITTSDSGSSDNSWGKYAMGAENNLEKKIRGQSIQGFGTGAGFTEVSNGTIVFCKHDLDISNASVNIGNNETYYITGDTDVNNITVADGVSATVYLDGVSIDHRNQSGKSPIELGENSKLDVVVIGDSYLYGAPASGTTPATAAIHVPESATLNINDGAGKLYAYGGDAAPGGNPPGENNGGAGAAAGIGGNGGEGAIAANQPGNNGGAGETAGTININDNAVVYAYGGAGGSGGAGNGTPQATYGAGGGGYPAAGIGGGGAGGGSGDHAIGGGGFSGGAARYVSNAAIDGNPGVSLNLHGAGGGYFAAASEGTGSTGGAIGGGGSKWYPTYTTSYGIGAGDGGAGGSAKSIRVGNPANVYAYNGSKLTTEGQSAADMASSVKAPTTWNVVNATVFRETAQSIKQGIGGGAGYTESKGNVTVAGAPTLTGTATAVRVDSAAHTSATITFPKATLPAGITEAITQYKIVASNGDSWIIDANTGAITGTSTGTATVGDTYTAVIGNLANNADLTFEVMAYNGNYSTPLTTGSIHTLGVPLAPRDVSVSIPENAVDYAQINWKAPDNAVNNLAVTAYKVVLSQYAKADPFDPTGNTPLYTDDTKQTVDRWDDAEAPTITAYVGIAGTDDPANHIYYINDLPTPSADGTYSILTNTLGSEKLKFGTIYNVEVSAQNNETKGDGTVFGAVASARVATPSIPGPVQNVRVEYTDHLNFTLKWDEPANANSVSPITEYQVFERVYTNAGSESSTAQRTYTGITGTEMTPENISNTKGKPGYKYVYEIVAINAANAENPSSLSNVVSYTVINPTTPNAPTDFQMSTRDDNNKVTIKWKAPAIPASDGSNVTQATGYKLAYQLAGNTAYSDVSFIDMSITAADGNGWLYYTLDMSEFPAHVADEWQKYDFWIYSYNTNTIETPENYEQENVNYYDAWKNAIKSALDGDGKATGNLDIPRISAVMLAGDRPLTRPTAPREASAVTTNTTKELAVSWKAPTDPGDIKSGDAEITAYNIYTQDYVSDGDAFDAANATLNKTVMSTDEALKYNAETEMYTYIIDGLTDGKKYSVFVTALNDNINNAVESNKAFAESVASNQATGTPRRQPDALSDVKAVSESGSTARLTWTIPQNDATGGDPVTKYVISVKTWDVAAGDWSTEPLASTEFTSDGNNNWTPEKHEGAVTIAAPQVGFGDLSTVMHSDISKLTSGVKYQISVQAINAAGTGDAVAAEVRTIHKPSVVQNVELTESDKKLSLTWTAPQDDGTEGSNLDAQKVTGYIVAYRTRDTATNYQYEKVEADALSWSNANLGNGTPYAIRVWAYYGEPKDAPNKADGWVADNDTSFFGEEVPLEGTPRTVPHAAVIGEVATGDKQATISTITAPIGQSNDPGNGGATITAYELWAVPVQETEAQKNGQYTVREGYTEEGIKKATISVDNVAEGVEAAAEVLIPELENGDENNSIVGNYLIYVKAVNAAGVGAASNKQFVRVGLPLAPTGLVGSLGDNREVIAAYNASISNGTPIKHYEIYSSTTEDGVKTLRNESVQGTRGTFTGEMNGKNLWIFVKAFNGVGYSPFSEGVQVTIGAPTTPQITKINAKSPASVGIQWTPSDGNGNRFDGYKVYYADITDLAEGGEPVYQEPITVTTTEYTFKDVMALKAGHRYSVYVTAINVAGESPKSEIREFSVGASDAPTIEKIESANSSLVVYFTPAEVAADAQYTKYKVYLNNSSDCKAEIPVSEVDTVTEGEGDQQVTYQKLIVEGLTNGMTYTVALSAVNKYGESEKSGTMTGTPATNAGALDGVTATAVSGKAIRVTWPTIAETGGSPVVGYQINVKSDEGVALGTTGDVGLVNSFIAGTTKVTSEDGHTAEVNNLYNGTTDHKVELQINTTYQVCVQALTRINGVVVAGEESAPVTVTTRNIPGKPTVTEVYSDSNGANYQKVTVHWTAPENDGGMPIKGYVLYLGSKAFNGPNGSSSNKEYYTEATEGVFEAVLPNRIAGTNLAIKVAAVSDVGTGEFSDVREHMVGTAKAPVIKEVSSDQNNLYVTWYGVGYGVADYDISSYTVYVKEPGSESYRRAQVIRNNNQETYTFTYEGNPGTHWVKIVPLNSWDSDENTYTEVPVTIGGLSAPVAVTATPGENEIHFAWTAPTVPEGFGAITGYTISYNDKQFIVNDPAATEFTLTTAAEAGGLIAGTYYSVSVAANNDMGMGIQSATQVVRPWGTPTAPDIGTITPDDGKFSFDYADASCVGIDVAPRYLYEIKATGEADFTTLMSGDYSVSSNKVTVSKINGVAVKNGVEYTIRVTADYGLQAGKTVAVSSSEHVVVCGLPEMPVLMNATPSNRGFTVRLQPSNLATSYRVYAKATDGKYYKPTGEASDTEAYHVVNADEIKASYYSLTYSRMTNGMEYTVWAVAENSAGLSANSNELKVTPGTAPAPVISEAYSSSEEVTLKWLVSSDSTVYTYYVYQDGKKILEVNGTETKIGGLVNGVAHTYWVTAVNSQGESTPSEAKTLAAGAPSDAVTNLQAALTNVTHEAQQVTLTWDAPAQTGGLPVTYVVTGDGLPTAGITTSDTTYAVDGLGKGKTCSYSVAAKNDAGISAAVTTTVKTATEPAAPIISETNGYNNRFVINWTAADNGGSEILSYKIYINNVFVGEVPGSVLTYTYNNDPDKVALNRMESYTIVVKAINAVGEGEGNSQRSMYVGILESSVPDAPTISSVTASAAGSLTVNWQKPAYDGNSTILGYKVYYAEKSAYDADGESALQQSGGTYGAAATSAEIKGLTNGTDYVFAVVANNAKGDSAKSDVVTGTPRDYTAPNAPVITQYRNNYEMTSTTFTWTYEPPAGGADLPTKFNVYVGMGSNVSYGTYDYVPGTNTYTANVEGLQAGVLYYVRVSATNYLDASCTQKFATTDSTYIKARSNLNVIDESGSLKFEDADNDGNEDNPIVIKAPDAPQDVKLSRSGMDITLEWTEPEFKGADDQTIDQYTLYINTARIPLTTLGAVEDEQYGGTYAYDEHTKVYTYTFGGIINNSYTCQVTSTNTAGKESNRSAAMVLYLTASYERPTNLQARLVEAASSISLFAGDSSATSPGYQIELNWDKLTESGLTGYMLYVNGKEFVPIGADGKVNTADLISPNAESYTYTDVKDGETYVFRLSAWYGDTIDTESPQSIAATVNVVSDTGLPGKVDSLIFNESQLPNGERYVTAAWTAVVNVAKYNVYVDGKFAQEVTASDIMSTAYIPFVAEKVYTVQVAGVNTSGNEGPKSDPQTYSTYTTPPSLEAPTNLQATTDIRTSSINLEWTQVAEATGYLVEIITSDGTSYTLADVVAQPASGTPVSLSIPNYAEITYLDETGSPSASTLDVSNSEFLLQVIAIKQTTPLINNNFDEIPPEESQPSEPVVPEVPADNPGTTEEPQKPNDPNGNTESGSSGETGETTGNTENGTSNEPSTDNTQTGNTSTETNGEQSNTTDTPPTVEDSTGNTSDSTESGTTPETTITDTVVPTAHVPEGAEQSLPAVISISTKSMVPDAPTDFLAKLPEDMSGYQDGQDIPITLTWTAPVFVGGNGSSISGYKLYVDEASIGTEAITITDPTSLQYVYTGKTNKDYSFRLSAINSVGESVFAATTANTKLDAQITPPAAPTITQYLSDGTHIKVFWNDPETNPGEPITHYLLAIDGEWVQDSSGDLQIAVNDAGTYTYTYQDVGAGTHTIEIKSVSEKAAGASATATANTTLNMVDDLVEATTPGAGSALDANMNGIDDSKEGDTDKFATLSGTVNTDGMSGEVTLAVYLNSDMANVILTEKATIKAGESSTAFTINAPLAVTGTYTLVISKQNHISVTMTDIPASTVSVLDLGKNRLISGDCNNDGRITASDLGLVSTAMGKSYDETADANGDGRITASDTGIVATNIGWTTARNTKSYSSLAS